MKKIIVVIILTIFGLKTSIAQTVIGTVIDQESKEPLSFVKYRGNKDKEWFQTDESGNFNYVISESDSLLFVKAGYLDTYEAISSNNKPQTVQMIMGYTLNSVIISAQRTEVIKNSFGLNNITLDVNELRFTPKFMGQVDILNALQIVPGISIAKEGTTSLVVRGGSPNQNLILLNNIPVISLNHNGGILSTFDPEIINSVNVYKGGFPSKYNGRLSSVIDLTTKNGNKSKPEMRINVGILSTSFLYSTPISKSKGSLIASARRMNYDLPLSAIHRFTKPSDYALYTFYDTFLKFTYELNHRNRLETMIFMARDKIKLNSNNELSSLNYKYNSIAESKTISFNRLGSIRYHFKVNSIVSNTLDIYYSSYKNKINSTEYTFDTRLDSSLFDLSNVSSVSEFGLKEAMNLYPNNNIKLTLGTNIYAKHITPSNFAIQYNQTQIKYLIYSFHYINNEIYINTNYTHKNLRITAGLNYQILMTENYRSKKILPRALVSYTFHKQKTEVNFSYAKITQDCHIISNSGLGLANDLWLPVTEFTPLETSTNLSLGISKKWNNFEMAIEYFNKKYDNLPTFKEGYSITNSSNNWKDKITIGSGQSSGIEFYSSVSNTRNKIILSYTYSNSIRKFPDINHGKPFPYNYNNLNTINLLWVYKFKTKNSLSAQWIYNSGSPYTSPNSYFQITNMYNASDSTPYVSSINNTNYPDYHRLDISYTIFKQLKKGYREWSFGIFNLYNRYNVFYIYSKPNYISNTTEQFKYTLFPILPSVSYTRVF